MEFKKFYTKEELDEVSEWFEQRLARLPQTLQISKAVCSTDLPRTIEGLILSSRNNGQNPNFGGQFRWLFLIRELLIQQGLD